MLIFFAIVMFLVAMIVGVLIAFANGMSDAPDDHMTQWPTVVLILFGALLLLLHVLLRHHAVTW